jgi:lysozyme
VNRIEEQLLLHEGFRAEPYLDTEGNWTVGVGYNITGRGLEALESTIKRRLPRDLQFSLTRDEALAMLRVDVNRVERAVRMYFPEYADLNEVRQRVCVDMAFNMGYTALGFKKVIAALKRRDWSAREMFKSKWAGQVGDGEGGRWDRADRLSKMILTGQDYVR